MRHLPSPIQPKHLARSMIQEELVREAILAECFPLVEKQRKKGRRSRELSPVRQRPATNSASISEEEKIKSALEQLLAFL